jgi:hypothetical protein
MKKSSVFEWHKWFKRVARTWKMMKQVVVQDLTGSMKIVKKSGICCIQMLSVRGMAVQLNLVKETDKF